MARALIILPGSHRQGETNALDNLRCAHGVVVAGRQQRIHAGRVYPYFAAPGTRVSAHPNHPRSTSRLVRIVRLTLPFPNGGYPPRQRTPCTERPVGRSLSSSCSDRHRPAIFADRDCHRCRSAGVLPGER